MRVSKQRCLTSDIGPLISENATPQKSLLNQTVVLVRSLSPPLVQCTYHKKGFTEITEGNMLFLLFLFQILLHYFHHHFILIFSSFG